MLYLNNIKSTEILDDFHVMTSLQGLLKVNDDDIVFSSDDWVSVEQVCTNLQRGTWIRLRKLKFWPFNKCLLS